MFGIDINTIITIIAFGLLISAFILVAKGDNK